MYMRIRTITDNNNNKSKKTNKNNCIETWMGKTLFSPSSFLGLQLFTPPPSLQSSAAHKLFYARMRRWLIRLY